MNPGTALQLSGHWCVVGPFRITALQVSHHHRVGIATVQPEMPSGCHGIEQWQASAAVVTAAASASLLLLPLQSWTWSLLLLLPPMPLPLPPLFWDSRRNH